MADIVLDEIQVKTLVKEAFIELLQEEKEVLYELFAEIIEDMTLLNAIKEGESTESIAREEVFQILEGAA